MSLEGSNIVHHHLWRIKNTELNEIYATMALRTLATSLIAIFIPIFLLTNGYSLRVIIVLYLMMYIVEILLEYPCAQWIRSLGPKHVVAYSFPFIILHFWLLKTIPVYHWPLWLIAVTGGATMALFWQAYHYDFSKTKHRKKAASEVSKLYIGLAVLGAAAPLIGGIIVTHFGFSWLYILVIALFCLAAIPLFKTGEPHRADRPVDLNRIKTKDIKWDMISYMGNGIEVTATATFWPIFIYFIVINYQSVGIVTSAALFITIVVTYYVGKRADIKNRKRYIKFGGYLSGVVFALQTLAYSVLHVFFFNIARSFANSFYNAPYTSEYYLHADEQSRSEYMFYMESSVDFGRIVFFGILLVSTYFLPLRGVLVLALILGALGAILITVMPAAKCEICDPIVNKKISLIPRPAKR